MNHASILLKHLIQIRIREYENGTKQELKVVLHDGTGGNEHLATVHGSYWKDLVVHFDFEDERLFSYYTRTLGGEVNQQWKGKNSSIPTIDSTIERFKNIQKECYVSMVGYNQRDVLCACLANKIKKPCKKDPIELLMRMRQLFCFTNKFQGW